MKNQSKFEIASFDNRERSPGLTREIGAPVPPRALVRFTPDARMSDISALLDNYQAAVSLKKAADARGGGAVATVTK